MPSMQRDIGVTADFSLDTMEAKRRWNSIFTAGKGNKKVTVNLEFLHNENIFQDEGENVLHQNYRKRKS